MIGTTAAIIGASVIGAGASMYGASKASKAAGNAADKNAQVQREQYQQTRSDLAPFTNGGYAATGALMQRLGLAGPAPAATATKAGGYAGSTPAVPDTGAGVAAPAAFAAPSGGVDYAQVLRDRPDVMAEYQKVAAVADPNSPQYQKLGLDRGAEGFAQQWYDNRRNPADYAYQAPAAQAPAPASTTPAPPIPGQTFTSADNGGLGPRQTFDTPNYGEAPSLSKYLDPKNFETSPGYQFRLNEGTRNLNAGYGAKGLLKSGAAMQGITDYGQGQASSEFNNWFNQQFQKLTSDRAQWNQDRNIGLNQFNTDRGVSNQNFESDRGYNTNRYDTYTGNLFNLAGIGQSAAAGTAAAGQNYAAGMTSNNNSLASVQGNAAIAGANGVNSAINSGMQAYGMSQNPFSVNANGNPFGGSYSTPPFNPNSIPPSQAFGSGAGYKFSPF